MSAILWGFSTGILGDRFKSPRNSFLAAWWLIKSRTKRHFAIDVREFATKREITCNPISFPGIQQFVNYSSLSGNPTRRLLYSWRRSFFFVFSLSLFLSLCFSFIASFIVSFTVLFYHKPFSMSGPLGGVPFGSCNAVLPAPGRWRCRRHRWFAAAVRIAGNPTWRSHFKAGINQAICIRSLSLAFISLSISFFADWNSFKLDAELLRYSWCNCCVYGYSFDRFICQKLVWIILLGGDTLIHPRQDWSLWIEASRVRNPIVTSWLMPAFPHRLE